MRMGKGLEIALELLFLVLLGTALHLVHHYLGIPVLIIVGLTVIIYRNVKVHDKLNSIEHKVDRILNKLSEYKEDK